MLYLMVILFISSFTLSCGHSQDKFRLIDLWQTERILKVPESVCYDAGQDRLFVSNINGKPTEKNGQGYITKMKTDGTIEALKWATGLNAPKGSAVFKDHFYVSDIDRLVEIDRTSGKILNRYPAARAEFLNDVAVDERGLVYVSDMGSSNSVIYRLEKGQLVPWLRGKEISSPNGLFIKGNLLYVGNSGDGKLKSVELSTKKIMTVAEVGTGIDGLIATDRGDFLVTDWQGSLKLIHPDGSIELLQNTTPQKINAADIGFISEKNIILIPTFFDNRVTAHRLVFSEK